MHLRPSRPIAIDLAPGVPAEAVWPREATHPASARPPAAGDAPSRDRLGRPAPARERRRPLFHPRRGWLRRLERRASHWLAREVYSRLPGIHLPYDWQLKRHLVLSQAEIAIEGLGAGLDGLRVLLVSDVHAGPFVSPAALRATFDKLAAVEPDLVLLGGDLTTTHAREFVSHRAAFDRLRAPLGVFAVLGNHDHYSRDPERLRLLLEEAGIAVLHNRAVILRRGGASLALAGVDDFLLGESDLDAALAGTESPVLLLSHNPDLFFEAMRRGVALMLSGHTHGGQIRVPGLPVLVRQSRFRLDEGRFARGGTELVVSRGLGSVGLPWRVACPPEAVLIRLRAAR